MQGQLIMRWVMVSGLKVGGFGTLPMAGDYFAHSFSRVQPEHCGIR